MQWSFARHARFLLFLDGGVSSGQSVRVENRSAVIKCSSERENREVAESGLGELRSTEREQVSQSRTAEILQADPANIARVWALYVIERMLKHQSEAAKLGSGRGSAQGLCLTGMLTQLIRSHAPTAPFSPFLFCLQDGRQTTLDT